MNKNIIVEIDEGTRQMINQIKDSVASGIDPSITRVEERVRKEMDNVSGELSVINTKQASLEKNIKDIKSTIEELDDQLADLLDGMEKLENIPDLSPLATSLDQSFKVIGQLEQTISDVKFALQSNQSSTDEKIKSLETLCDSQYKMLSEVASSGFEKQSDVSNGLGDMLGKLKDQLEGLQELSDEQLSSLSARMESGQSSTDEKIKSLETLCNSQYKMLSEVASSGFEKQSDVSNELGDMLGKLKDQLEGLQEQSDKQLSSLSARIENSEKTLVKESTELASLHTEKIRKVYNDQIKLVIDTLNKKIELIEKNGLDLHKRLESVEGKFNDAFRTIKESMKKEIQERRESQMKLESQMDRMIELISGVSHSVETSKDTNEAQHSSIMEKLQQILMTVTPFWKRKNI